LAVHFISKYSSIHLWFRITRNTFVHLNYDILRLSCVPLSPILLFIIIYHIPSITYLVWCSPNMFRHLQCLASSAALGLKHNRASTASHAYRFRKKLHHQLTDSLMPAAICIWFQAVVEFYTGRAVYVMKHMLVVL
jgi:hypothetical protein